MIYIFASSITEARPLIKALNLKRDISHKAFEIYTDNSEKQFHLTITGTGEENAASAVSYAVRNKINNNDYFINVGIAAGTKETALRKLYRINKIHFIENSKDFYPFIYSDEFEEAPIFSGNKVLKEFPAELEKTPLLYDMESAGFFIAASHFVAPDKIIIIKTVSDNGIKNEINLGKSINDAVNIFSNEKLINFLYSLLNVENKAENKEGHWGEEYFLCSASMREEYYKMLSFCEKADLSFDFEITKLIILGYLPVKNRKQGKLALSELKKNILSEL